MIIRAENRKTFTIISNELLNDNRITDKALGTLVRLLSNADSWNININYLAKTGKQGRTAIRSSIAELEKAGYIHRDVVRNEAGRITGTEYVIYEQAVAKVKGVDKKSAPSMEGTTGVSSNLSSPPVTEEAVTREQISEGVSIRKSPLEVSSNLRQPLIHKEAPEQNTTSQVKTATRDKNQSQENRSQETSPVINTNIEQRRRVTTTTAPAEPVIDVEVLEPSSSYPATKDINSLLDLIPEHHQQPMVKALVNRAVEEYSPLEVQEAIAYASANVKGGALQYKAYLDKTLKNQWAAGYLETMQEQSTTPALFPHGGFAGGMPAGRFLNGTITGSARMDSNYQAAAEFLAKRRGRHDQ